MFKPIQGNFEKFDDEIFAKFFPQLVHIEVSLSFVEGEVFGEDVEKCDKVLIVLDFVFCDKRLFEIILYFLHQLNSAKDNLWGV